MLFAATYMQMLIWSLRPDDSVCVVANMQPEGRKFIG